MSPCIEWTGYIAKDGYGRIGGRVASRVLFERAHGWLPPNIFVCHSCDNPKCVNLEHLFIGEHRDNMADMVAKGRQGRHGKPGESHPNHKLTATQVAEIRRRLAGGASQASMCRAYGISSGHMNRIAHNKRWKSPEAGEEMVRGTRTGSHGL